MWIWLRSPKLPLPWGEILQWMYLGIWHKECISVYGADPTKLPLSLERECWRDGTQYLVILVRVTSGGKSAVRSGILFDLFIHGNLWFVYRKLQNISNSLSPLFNIRERSSEENHPLATDPTNGPSSRYAGTSKSFISWNIIQEENTFSGG